MSHRRRSLVLVGGDGALGGQLAAAGLSALLQPHFGWRIMWFLDRPSGLMLIASAPLIPESLRFLLHVGRPDEARATLERFGALMITPAAAGEQAPADEDGRRPAALRSLIGTTMALGVAGLSWGFVNFGLLLWLPGELIAAGRDMGLAAALLARSSLLAAPVVIFAAVLYWRWSTKGALLAMTAVTAVAALFGLILIVCFGQETRGLDLRRLDRALIRSR